MKTTRLAILAAVSLALAAPALAAPINQREGEQQTRINHGVVSGHLTPHEAAHDQRRLDRNEAHVDRQRARNGGVLTASQRMRDQRRMNHSSRRIYDTKHNGRVG